MTYQETMRRLEEAGNEQTRKIYQRHGAGANVFGVKISDLQKLRKGIGKDHRLAAELWESGNADAMMLATMIAEPRKMTEAELDAWAERLHYYGVADMFARDVASNSGHFQRCIDVWRDSPREYVAQCGWVLIAVAAMNDARLTDSFFETALEKIEDSIAASPNRVRYAMNNALIAIGLRNDSLRAKALAAAQRIGTVEVDHGETGCATPDAAAYIAKALARRTAKTGG